MEKRVINMFSGKDIIQNDKEKYSAMLSDLIKPFENDFPLDMDAENIIGFACNAWNMACMSQIMPKKEFNEMLLSEPFPEPEASILKKIIDLKKKKFAKHERFISDFTLNEKNGETILTVLTQEKEMFFANLMEEEHDFMPEEADLEEAYINRYAIVIKPRQPFFVWINALYPDSPVNEVNEANVYLVDDDIDDVDKWLKKKFDTFFMMELDDWHQNKKEWPQKRNYKMFKEWFHIEFSTMVYDMEKRPVSKEF